jgi:dihydrofolate synthase/folylpolyglutamate synthase
VGDRLSDYQQALDYLFVRTTGQWRFGLERTAALLAALGNPHHALRVIHVGGTNGKGSVCAMIDRALRDRGFRVGRYTSPHLIDFRERMLIDGAPLEESSVVEFIRQWTPEIERIGATFFEATTAMAFRLLADERPDVAVVEVGLGGRLDATNVVDPLLSVVTSIALDHTEYLGDTIEEIASEKAGIFKPDRVALIGERNAGVARLLERHARDAGAADVVMVRDRYAVSDVVVEGRGTSFSLAVDASPGARVVTSLHGGHQALNAATALATLGALPHPLRTSVREAQASLARVELPGRFHTVGRFTFDVAHNPSGAAVVAETMQATRPGARCVVVLSILADKDWRAMMAMLSSVAEEFVLTVAPTSPANRRWDVAAAKAEADARGWTARVVEDFDEALAVAARGGRHILVTGSFHTVGDAMARLHVSPFPG